MPSTELRINVLTEARQIVVKLGTQLLRDRTPGARGLDQAYLREIASQVATLRRGGREVAVVSSGAIGAGCAELGLDAKPVDLSEQQAVAAIGQRRLMTHMHDAFAEQGLAVGQVLVTRTDFDDRDRFLNIRNCITKLHEMGAVAILNENDAVAVDELRFGDNDLLAAMTCHALRAQALVLLSVVDGLLDADGHAVDLVDDMQGYLSFARQDKSRWGSGGILSKLDAARLVMEAGEIAVIANGRTPDVLTRLFAGEKIGTIFMPGKRRLDSRRRWIGLTVRPQGTLTINAGAAAALREQGKSLLAVGVVEMTGQFKRGDVLLVRDATGKEVARGLSNYDANELRLIMGKHSEQFESILGHDAYDTVIHRDHLLVKGNG